MDHRTAGSSEPAYEAESPDAAQTIRAALVALDGPLADTDVPGVLFLYDEAHLLGDDRRAARFPLSSLLAGFGQAQRTSSRVRLVLCGLPTLSLNLKRARTYAERMFSVGDLDVLSVTDHGVDGRCRGPRRSGTPRSC